VSVSFLARGLLTLVQVLDSCVHRVYTMVIILLLSLPAQALFRISIYQFTVIFCCKFINSLPQSHIDAKEGGCLKIMWCVFLWDSSLGNHNTQSAIQKCVTRIGTIKGVGRRGKLVL